jgi:hypothetical protein
MSRLIRYSSKNDLRVQTKGNETRLLKTGLYAFDSERGTVQVFDGKAAADETIQQITCLPLHYSLQDLWRHREF